MFGRLLTPLVNRFDLSPRPDALFEHNEEEETALAENFARDVRIELMRNSIESLKEAQSLEEKIEAMGEIHRIMVEEPSTKDVFRELDGYLLLVNVLTILQPFLERNDLDLKHVEEGGRFVFVLLTESFDEHVGNQQHFKDHVGYDSLGEALIPLVINPRTVDVMYGFLLSLARGNFALSSIFAVLRSQDKSEFSEYLPLLGTIRNGDAYVLLFTLLPHVSTSDTFLIKAVYALTEALIAANHRNAVLLSNTQLFRNTFDQFIESAVPTMKLVKKLVEIGTERDDVRYLFQHAVQNGALQPDAVEIIRSGMKAKWPMHFSMERVASVQFEDKNVRGLPSTGFTFMIWLYVERFPHTNSQTVFSVRSKSRKLMGLSLRSDGVLELMSSESTELAVLDKATVKRARWTHLVLVHHPHRASNPTIRVFVDGMLVESKQWAYPRTDSMAQTLTYAIGEADPLTAPSMSWSFASSYMVSLPLPDDVPHIIQHLGPRYAAHFQTKDLYRFLTYEASTSLNVFLSSLVAQRMSAGRNHRAGTMASSGSSPTLRLLMEGIGVSEEAFLFSIFVSGFRCDDGRDRVGGRVAKYCLNGASSPKVLTSCRHLEVLGDVVPSTQECLDIALWKIGGAAVALRLVELASSAHELSRTLGIFGDAARTSWQMSEDMECLHAFEILAHILHSKSQLINLTAFETLFEFLGVNFRNPDRSVIVNSVAYRSIALDFGIWASARVEIQEMHLEHFKILLKTSKYRTFNAKQRIAKFNVVRQMIFVLQTNWYAPTMVGQFVSALKCVTQACFSDDTIKPIVSFLAASLHEGNSVALSPRSIVSQMDSSHVCNKAEQVLVALVSILSTGNYLSRFSAVLPLPRICLLLLGDKPSSTVALQVLTIIGLALKASSSFIRKFELVSGWTVLKVTLPEVWNAELQRAAFDIVFGRTGDTNDATKSQRNPSVACPHLVPSILASLGRGLSIVIQDSLDEEATITGCSVESLLEELMQLLSLSPSFRQVFKSQQTTALLIGAYSNFVSNGHLIRANKRTYIRILEKMSHFVMALALDNVTSSSQKHEMLAVFQRADALLNSDSLNSSPTDDYRASSPINTVQNAHAHVHVLSERAYQKTMNKIRDWRNGIIASEKNRLRRTALDLLESRRHAEQDNSWRNSVYDDRGLWISERLIRSWVLDETEGPCRVRKKTERKVDASSSLVVNDEIRAVTEPDNDAQSFVQVELVVPPWAEGYEFQPADEDQWIDEFADDKLRRVRKELENGDIIEGVCTVTRIVGVDSSPGLLLLGRSHLYMLDGLVENEDGEVIEAAQAPRNLFTVPGSVLELDGKQRTQKWVYDQIASFSRKTCLFRDVALELYFKDNRSLLIVFPNKRRRQDICDNLTSSIAARNHPVSRSPLVLHRTPLFGKAPTKLMAGMKDELATAQRKWQAREISNFSYISILNQSSGRTPGDATQYPIFPWVLADYSSEALDLSSPSTFRDLSRPMGALAPARREAARQRYDNLKSVGETPFHYGTHFSSSMIVCHFLIRLEPFTHMFKKLQGGDWDLPDRLFVDVARAYHSASQDMRGDVRELIPEFFTCPEFLQNLANVDFGVQQNTGEKIHDVKLPPWAKGDPLLFIMEHRKALESDFVSENLPSWIDLVWGYKQRDVDSVNVFHPLSYEGSIDLDKITDELQRQATVGIIHNFGQTPRKLFDGPHPERIMHGPTTLPLGTQFGAVEDVHLFIQSPRPVAEISDSVMSLTIDLIAERVIPSPKGILCVPSLPHEQIAWGFVDQSIKLLVDRKVMQVAEAISCACVAFVDSDRFISGSYDCMVRFWDMERKDGRTSLFRTHGLRSHSAAVLCVAACRSWSLVVSGSEDGTAVIWDLNRAAYVRTIDHRDTEDKNVKYSVYLVAINESTGYIATCSERMLYLHTINAYLIVALDLSHGNPSDGSITSLAFHEREYARLGMLATGTNMGSISLRTWTTADTPAGQKALWKFFTLRKLRCREGSDGKVPKVTALEFVGESLYHGEDSGRVFSWDLPE